MLTDKAKNDFFKVADSLKRFKRAEIKDDRDRPLIETLYTDLLPENQVYKMSLSDNTTFLVGRKGTGKSTIILYLENEYRKRGDYLPCYIDTKTVFESTKSDYQGLDYLKGKIPEGALEKYLIERSFIQSTLKAVIKELETKTNSFISKIACKVGLNKSNDVKAKVIELFRRVENNEHLKSIELPVINEYVNAISNTNEQENANSWSEGAGIAGCLNANGPSVSANIEDKNSTSNKNKEIEFWEKRFSGALLKVFQIKSIIDEIKEILRILDIKKIVIFLDDFSEVEESTLKNFVDVVLAPLNNWGDEFICFKVAAYPNRVYFGEIDKGKVDVIDLDFYNLYSDYDKSTMEALSLDFTKRLITKRLNYYSTTSLEDFFDLKSSTLDEYFEMLFQASMNVPRIIGYILFYCHQTHISLGKKINKGSINSASEKYYEKVISSFFDVTSHSLLSFNEKVSELQQRELLKIFVDKLKLIRKQIITGELTGSVYQSDKNNPYTSHFNFSPNLEKFISTLELNFFISKYAEMSDRDGRKVSIYCLNHGLTLMENMRWGKPSGSDYRKYYIARPFDFNKVFEDFLRESKHIACINPACGKTYPYEQLQYLEFNKMRCVDCQSKVSIQSVSENIEDELNKIDKEKLLPGIELSVLYELNGLDSLVYARDLAEELDVSSYLIAKRAEKLDRNRGLVNRDRSEALLRYSITEKAKREYFEEL